MRWCTVKAQNPLSRCCHAKVSNDVESQWCFPKGLRWLTNKLHTKTGITKLKTLWNNTERAKYFIKLPPLYWFACETSSNYFIRTLQYDGWLLLLPSIYLERVYFNQFFPCWESSRIDLWQCHGRTSLQSDRFCMSFVPCNDEEKLIIFCCLNDEGQLNRKTANPLLDSLSFDVNNLVRGKIKFAQSK